MKTPHVSRAWSCLHRCVEANAGTTGEPFRSIFGRIEAEFKIDRSNKNKWPSLTQIHEIALKLKKEREEYLALLNKLIKERRGEKKNGKRVSSNAEFLRLTHRQTNHVKPKLKPWGWRDRRMNG